MLLFKGTLSDVHCRFMDTELVAHSAVAHTWAKRSYHMRSLRETCVYVKSTLQHSLGVILNCEITSSKHKNAKKCGIKCTAKRTFVYSMGGHPGAEHGLGRRERGPCTQGDASHSLPCTSPRVPAKAPWLLTWRLEICSSEKENLKNMESMNN